MDKTELTPEQQNLHDGYVELKRHFVIAGHACTYAADWMIPAHPSQKVWDAVEEARDCVQQLMDFYNDYMRFVETYKREHPEEVII